MKCKILLVEDHTVIREGLRTLLSAEPDTEVIGEASTGLEALACVRARCPDLILMDVSMPDMNGIETTREIKRRCPKSRIVILSARKTAEDVRNAAQAGADGYVTKSAPFAELMRAIRGVFKQTAHNADASATLCAGLAQDASKALMPSAMDTLTGREREILKLIAEGYTSKEIAQKLYLSMKTVEKHRSNLMKKLDLHKAAALATFAIAHGLTSDRPGNNGGR